jgi:hypothetical protein
MTRQCLSGILANACASGVEHERIKAYDRDSKWNRACGSVAVGRGIMPEKMPLYLGAAALLLVLAAPALAQTLIIQDNNSSSFSSPTQTDSNRTVVLTPGSAVTSAASQQAGTLYNAIGPAGALAVSGPFTITQAAGAYDLNGVVTTGSVDSTASNLTGAGDAMFPALSTVAAAGSQSAANAVNLASIAPPAAATGSLTQVVGYATLDASNGMFGVVADGAASVLGSDEAGGPGVQQALGTLDTAGVDVTNAADLTLSQELTGPNSVTAVNSAVAHSIAAAAALDPNVRSLAQSAGIGVNQLSVASTGASATATLDGSQNVPSGAPTTITVLVPVQETVSNPSPPPSTIVVTRFVPEERVAIAGITAVVGNTAVAYSGPASPTYGLDPAAGGTGSASISAVTQNASVELNSVVGGAGVSLALTDTLDPADGFLQTAIGSAIDGPSLVSTPYGNVLPNVINGIIATTGTGSATITGTALAAANAAATQSFSNEQNVIMTGASLSGTAMQEVRNVSALPGVPGLAFGLDAPGFYNVVLASASTGPAGIADVSQSLGQSYNTAQSASSSGLALDQNAESLVLASNNLQLATGSTNATIAGAVQSLNSSVNVAALGPSLDLALTQSAGTAATPIGIVNSNQLQTNGLGTSLAGQQFATASLNVAALGSFSGSLTQTATAASLTNTNTLGANAGFAASLSGVQQAASAINVIR